MELRPEVRNWVMRWMVSNRMPVRVLLAIPKEAVPLCLDRWHPTADEPDPCFTVRTDDGVELHYSTGNFGRPWHLHVADFEDDWFASLDEAKEIIADWIENGPLDDGAWMEDEG
jgi:hypothetical protein